VLNAMDGVPDVTQPPVKPGVFTYQFVAKGPAMGVPLARTRRSRCLTACSASSRSVTRRCRRTPDPLPNPDGPQRRGRDRPVAQRKVVCDGAGDHTWAVVEITYFNEGLQIHPTLCTASHSS
jgi:hypothetical protein